MKTTLMGRTAIGLVTVLALGLVLSGCGRKGPLYLPDQGKAPAAAAAGEQSESERKEDKKEGDRR